MAGRARRILGVDVGGTAVKYGLFDARGDLLEDWREPTVPGEALLDAIAGSVGGRMAARGLGPEDILGMGVCVPGPVDADGTVEDAPNVGWRRLNIPEAVRRRLPVPVVAANDGNAAAVGEVWRGCGVGCRNFLLVTLGTGIGGGVIMNGALLTGADGACGEIGHMHLMDAPPPTGPEDLRGTFEYWASATGLARVARARLAASDAPSALRGGPPDAERVFDAAARGDALALEILERYGRCLGKGLANLATVLNPERIALGGGMSAAGEALIACARPAFEAYAYPLAARARLCLAALGNRAGVVGAAKLALDRFGK